MSEREVEDLLILGAGPAGYTAAIYTARARLDPLLFTGREPGGQLETTTEVENYPGFEEGVMGPELMKRMRAQAERFGARIEFGWATGCDLGRHPFEILVTHAEKGEIVVRTKALIVATGASPRVLGLEGEKDEHGQFPPGLSVCATCDGHFYREKELIVVGGGDSAVEEAIFLTRYATKVSIVHRRDELRASKIMQERAVGNEKIEVIWDTVVKELRFDGPRVVGVLVENVKTGETSKMPIGGVFYALGHIPTTDFLDGRIETDENGYVLLGTPFSTATSVPGVFAAGDCADHRYRQAITAAGSGCMAALDAQRFLEEAGE